MKTSVGNQILKLGKLSKRQLTALWEQQYRKTAPAGIRRELIIPFLAYKIQETAEGSLRPSVRAELRRIARSLDSSNSAGTAKGRIRVKAGTRLVRQWGGDAHEIWVTERGYEYREGTYGSLSEIARLITGTRWSGPAFFGLRRSVGVRSQRHG